MKTPNTLKHAKSEILRTVKQDRREAREQRDVILTNRRGLSSATLRKAAKTLGVTVEFTNRIDLRGSGITSCWMAYQAP